MGSGKDEKTLVTGLVSVPQGWTKTQQQMNKLPNSVSNLLPQMKRQVATKVSLSNKSYCLVVPELLKPILAEKYNPLNIYYLALHRFLSVSQCIFLSSFWQEKLTHRKNNFHAAETDWGVNRRVKRSPSRQPETGRSPVQFLKSIIFPTIILLSNFLGLDSEINLLNNRKCPAFQLLCFLSTGLWVVWLTVKQWLL